MVKLKIDNFEVEVPEGTSILEAARKVHIDIPTLCKHPDVDPTAGCGLCIVKVNGRILRSCCTPVAEGMEVVTGDAEIVAVRRTVLELILSNHPNECLTCIRSGHCELQDMANTFGIASSHLPSLNKKLERDESTEAIVLDPSKCIVCGRCVEVCQNQQNVWALSYLNRGLATRVTAAGGIPLADSPCIKCGQCSAHCPTGAIVEYDDTQKVWEMLQDPETYTIVQIAPAVRVAIGEEFGYDFGENLTGKTYAALRRLGFNRIFDTNFGADLTIIEEATEFVNRFTKKPESLPMFTSCCPAWVDMLEKTNQDMIDNFSTCKSPQAMVGALAKTYYAEKMSINPAKIRVVSVMPCTAKKWEIKRDKDMCCSGYQDVDVSLTTRELCRMIKQAGVDFRSLPEETADSPLGEYSGAGTIFGVTGGVMTAALRTAYFYITGEELGDINFKAIEGLDGIKEAEIDIKGNKVKIAVAHGCGNIDTILNRIRAAKANGEEMPYHFVEVMACRGGCISGGGQPRVMMPGQPKPRGITDDIRRKRAAGLMNEDLHAKNRLSHQNESVKTLYKEYLGDAGGEKAHHLLHTHYVARASYKK
ncbi:MAG: iron hydrogenase small subunit [Alphaproteobacteria bacterium]|nr:2Fe-2S iron-sulfur cluster binding domain-containing protein [Alphaproteobacteria bacterium]MBQ7285315.1 iron hydrogenase small subunit [Alphaproteobacteria bacterium]